MWLLTTVSTRFGHLYAHHQEKRPRCYCIWGIFAVTREDADISRVVFLGLVPQDARSQEHKTLHVSDSSSVHHQEFFTIHTTMVYVIQVCWQIASSKLSANLYVLLCVQWKTPDDWQRKCPRHVEFYSKNKFDKLVHMVGYIIRIYHDARSPERQK